ncbi:HlyD family secretion protein [Thalassotalea maritima]|uniref:HlyD family secretion protein n=1 Tax=Thalassotalea maritima TaxID=3242416 RepID=UPI0035271AF1
MKIQFQTEKQKNPIRNDGFDVMYAPAKRVAFRFRWYLLVLLILSPLVIFGWHLLDDELLVQADGILTTQPVVLHAPQPVFVKKIKVRDGDSVTAKDILVELSSPVVERQYALLQTKHNTFKELHQKGLQNLELLYNQQIASLKASDRDSKRLSAKYKDYQQRGVLPLSDRLLIEQTDVQSKNRYQQALISFESAVSQHRNGPLAKTVLDIELALAEAQARSEMLNLVAPKGGLINEVLVEEGEFLGEGEPILTLSNLTEPVVIVYLQPKRMDYAKIGQTATIKFPNGDKYEGKINRPVQMTQQLPPSLTGPFDVSKAMIKITLDISPVPKHMVEGLPVKVRFHYDEEKHVKSWIGDKKQQD